MKWMLMAAVAAAALMIAPFSGGASTQHTTCPRDANGEGQFTGTAENLVVREDSFCLVIGAIISRDLIVSGPGSGAFVLDTTIGRNLVVGHDSEAEVGGTLIGNDLRAPSLGNLHLERTTIGGDLVAVEPTTVQTGKNAPGSPGGPVFVGQDVLIKGSPEGFEFVFDGICDLAVGRDFTITRRTVTLGIGLGEHCAETGRGPNTIGRDLIVTNNAAREGFFGPSSIEVDGNRVGGDLVFRANTAVPGGQLEVSDNIVGDDALCSRNDPAVTQDPADGPNRTGDRNTCG
jgi:hypothetical protein